jgi:signal transduction histidine kinase
VRFYGVVQNITERKQAEEQKLRLSVEQERLTMVNQFVEAFSHDVRTSLATIETSRYLIERLTADFQKVQLPTQLGKIHHAVNHLAEQLNNLHMVSSLADPNPIPCQLNRLIESLVAEHNLRAKQKRQVLLFEADPDLSIISADESKLRQAIQHLLLNALAHTHEGGSIILRTTQDESFVRIDVQDSGEGIAIDKLPQIFQPFYKTDQSRTLDSGGMGLGLSIVNMIVQAHGGQITVESEPGKGSIFTITLPISKTESTARQSA